MDGWAKGRQSRVQHGNGAKGVWGHRVFFSFSFSFFSFFFLFLFALGVQEAPLWKIAIVLFALLTRYDY